MKSYLFWRRSRCNRLVPTPVFGIRLRRQNFNLAPTQYRQLRRLTILYVVWLAFHCWCHVPVSRQSSSFCSILPITLPQSLWNLSKEVTCKSRVRALPLLKLKKKTGFSQSKPHKELRNQQRFKVSTGRVDLNIVFAS